MQENEDHLFNVVHSLPVLSYSVALAQRTPAAGFEQQTKYMPDYGGYLETTTSCLKNNALASGIPFRTKSERTRIEFVNSLEDTSDPVVCSNNCLIVTSYLESGTDFSNLSVIRLLDSGVTLHSLSQASEENFDALQYGHISSKNRVPIGLKHIRTRNDFYLLVKFTKSIKAYELNRSFNCDTFKRECHNVNQLTHNKVASVSDRPGYEIRDASLNPNNNNILAIASDNSNIHNIRLFDLSISPKQPFQNVEWATLSNEFPSTDTCLLSKELRGRVVRTFIPIRPTNWGTQQLDHIPSHLFNLLVTNEHKISLVDPRSCSLAQDYITKTELPTFYPVEYLRRTVFSNKNEYQFYSMTNVHVRVIDTRYPGVPIGQVGHMLESETYNSMDMKLIEYPYSNSETLCCSSSGRLSFVTFDQNESGSLINPKSTHLPYHDTSLNEDPIERDLPVFGLSVIASKSNDILFSIYQLSSKGDLLLRSYTGAEHLSLERSPDRIDLGQDRNPAPSVLIRQTHELPDRVILESGTPPSPEDLIDLLDSSLPGEIENKLESKRAQEKYELMKNKLRRI